MAIIAIFLPVAFMSGIIGKFFFQFGVVLSVAVAISLLEALTLAPARCSQFLQVGHRGNIIERGVGFAFDLLSKGYRKILSWIILVRFTPLALVFIIALTLTTLTAAIFIGPKMVDLIGLGCDCLIPAQPPKEALEKRRRQANEAIGDHYHTVANPAKGEKPGERGAEPAKGYRPGRKSAGRRQGKKKGGSPKP